MGTATLDFGRDFQEVIRGLKSTPEIGYRVARKQYQKEELDDIQDLFKGMADRHKDRIRPSDS